MKEKSVSELKAMIDSGEDIQIIDVREPHEYEICNINGELIPLKEVPGHLDRISKDKVVVVHCRSGARSSSAIMYLEQSHGYANLYNLRGGILAWADEIDDSMAKY
jgi:rhodanese-related sulfurtransferase